jgi:hypothetical protein
MPACRRAADIGGERGEIGYAIPPYALVALSQVAHVNVDVEIDVADASLHSAVRASLAPWPITKAGISDVGKSQASPLRQLAAAFSGKLPRQYGFLATLVETQNMWAQFAMAAFISADYLLFSQDCIAEYGVSGASH